MIGLMKPQQLTGGMGICCCIAGRHCTVTSWLSTCPQLAKQALAEGQNANTADVVYVQLACVSTWALPEVLLC